VRQPNRTKQALLGFLSWGPMSGYDIKKTIEGSISNFWSESYGQIYPILKRLEAEGLATCSKRAGGAGRDRNVYSITEAGRADLRRWLGEPTPQGRLRNELLLKLFFGRESDLATHIRRLEEHRAQQLADLERYRHIGQQLEAQASEHPDLPYWRMTLRYGEIEARARAEWCDETLARLRELARAEETSRSRAATSD
jgi:DNA-binding PadR family transcriptional regulator